MLVQLVPDQIRSNWGSISKAIRMSMPPDVRESDEVMHSILSASLTGLIRVWTLLDDNKPVAIVATTFSTETFSKTKNLIIYALYGLTTIPDDLWKTGLLTLKRYAKSNGCTRIIGYTDSNRIIKKTKELGGSVAHTIYLEV